MEDLIQVIIYLVVIFFFFSSFFKKKPQQKKPPENQNEYPDQEETYIQTEEPEFEVKQQGKQESPYDIFREIEDFFKVGEEQSTPPPVKQKERLSQGEDLYGEHSHTEDWHKSTTSEHQAGGFWEKKQKEVERNKKKVDSTLEKQAKKFEKLLEEKSKSTSYSSFNLKRKLREPASLKEYILISELLGRPKARRR